MIHWIWNIDVLAKERLLGAGSAAGSQRGAHFCKVATYVID
jgi:hypothetical protein